MECNERVRVKRWRQWVDPHAMVSHETFWVTWLKSDTTITAALEFRRPTKQLFQKDKRSTIRSIFENRRLWPISHELQVQNFFFFLNFSTRGAARQKIFVASNRILIGYSGLNLHPIPFFPFAIISNNLLVSVSRHVEKSSSSTFFSSHGMTAPNNM